VLLSVSEFGAGLDLRPVDSVCAIPDLVFLAVVAETAGHPHLAVEDLGWRLDLAGVAQVSLLIFLRPMRGVGAAEDLLGLSRAHRAADDPDLAVEHDGAQATPRFELVGPGNSLFLIGDSAELLDVADLGVSGSGPADDPQHVVHDHSGVA